MPPTKPIYDDPSFFTSYAQLPRSQTGLSAAPEWPALKRMVGNVHNQTILDLGCGYGWFCRWAIESGAASVLGVDIAAKMLARASEMAAGEGQGKVEYQQADVSAVELGAGKWDLVYSSLTLHYLAEVETFFERVFAALKSGGRFVFSCEHPVWTAVDGWFVTKEGELPVWPLNSYADEGRREKDWLGSKVVKYHRKLDSYVNGLLGAGFLLRELVEWTPSEEDLKAHPEWAMEVHRPAFLLVKVEKPL